MVRSRLARRRSASRWHPPASPLRYSGEGHEALEQTTAFGELFQRLARLDELDMRVGLLCERLEALSDDDAVQMLAEAHRDASLGSPEAQSVFLALGWTLFEPRVQTRREALGAAARQAGLHHVADFVAPPTEPDAAAEGKRPIPDFGRGRPLTLGERKSLARTHDRSLHLQVTPAGEPYLLEVDAFGLLLVRPGMELPLFAQCDPEAAEYWCNLP